MMRSYLEELYASIASYCVQLVDLFSYEYAHQCNTSYSISIDNNNKIHRSYDGANHNHQSSTALDMDTHRYERIFIQQNESWDCGLACCNMILRWSLHYDEASHDEDHDLIISFIELAGRSTPLWTIELFYLLKGYDIVELTMNTLYLGVNPVHSTIDWYTSSSTGMKDFNYELINNMFAQAIHQHHWSIHENAVSLQDLQQLVSDRNCIVMVLIDAFTLTRSKNSESSSYAGHYIILMDYLREGDSFVCLNPARNKGEMTIACDLIDRARTHIGTDQDLIICRRR